MKKITISIILNLINKILILTKEITMKSLVFFCIVSHILKKYKHIIFKGISKKNTLFILVNANSGDKSEINMANRNKYRT